jgi:hypothetical protein
VLLCNQRAMKSLASELASYAERLAGRPRIYADANIPAGVLAFLRTRLHWDVLAVIEHDDLRRLPDEAHFRLAGQLHRTLLSLDRDYLEDRRFPPAQCPGVLIISAPDEQGLIKLLSRLDRAVFRPQGPRGAADPDTLPLEGRKLHAYPDWRPAGTDGPL